MEEEKLNNIESDLEGEKAAEKGAGEFELQENQGVPLTFMEQKLEESGEKTKNEEAKKENIKDETVDFIALNLKKIFTADFDIDDFYEKIKKIETGESDLTEVEQEKLIMLNKVLTILEHSAAANLTDTPRKLLFIHEKIKNLRAEHLEAGEKLKELKKELKEKLLKTGVITLELETETVLEKVDFEREVQEIEYQKERKKERNGARKKAEELIRGFGLAEVKKAIEHPDIFRLLPHTIQAESYDIDEDTDEKKFIDFLSENLGYSELYEIKGYLLRESFKKRGKIRGLEKKSEKGELESEEIKELLGYYSDFSKNMPLEFKEEFEKKNKELLKLVKEMAAEENLDFELNRKEIEMLLTVSILRDLTIEKQIGFNLRRADIEALLDPLNLELAEKILKNKFANDQAFFRENNINRVLVQKFEEARLLFDIKSVSDDVIKILYDIEKKHDEYSIIPEQTTRSVENLFPSVFSVKEAYFRAKEKKALNKIMLFVEQFKKLEFFDIIKNVETINGFYRILDRAVLGAIRGKEGQNLIDENEYNKIKTEFNKIISEII